MFIVRGYRRGLSGVLLGATFGLLPAQESPPFDPSRMHADLAFLAHPVFAGRATGTPEAARAAAWLAGELMRLGAAPGAPGGGYLQAFPVILGTRRGARTHLDWQPGRQVPGEPAAPDPAPLDATSSASPAQPAPARWEAGTSPVTTLAAPGDWAPYPFSSDGAGTGTVCFAGYGISAPSLGYDDYAGLDPAGKILLVLEGEPRERDTTSPFRAPEAFRFRELRHKAITARDKGAAALLVVGRSDLPATTGEGPAGSRAGILLASLARRRADAMLAAAGIDLAAQVAAIEASGVPASRDLPGLRVGIEVQLEEIRGTGWNVSARVRGKAGYGESVLVGAHYDHLGIGSEGSLAPDQRGQPHLGADDNASGAAGLLALAREFLARPAQRDVIVAAFAGEEMGLLGSHHFVQVLGSGKERLAAMVNLDMVGRMQGGRLFVHGVDTGEGLRALVQAGLAGTGLSPSFSGDGYGPSDHTAFYAAGIPVLFFFTGPHVDYHRPSDTADKIDPAGYAAAVEAASRVIRTLADLPVPPKLVRTAAPPPAGGQGGRSDGYGAYFGSIPDFSESPGGVLLSGVRAGSPAEEAGVRAGDKIVRFAGRRIENLHDLTYTLRGLRAGDTVEVVVRRQDQETTLQATLRERK